MVILDLDNLRNEHAKGSFSKAAHTVWAIPVNLPKYTNRKSRSFRKQQSFRNSCTVGVSSRWLFRSNSARDSIETMTIGKMHLLYYVQCQIYLVCVEVWLFLDGWGTLTGHESSNESEISLCMQMEIH